MSARATVLAALAACVAGCDWSVPPPFPAQPDVAAPADTGAAADTAVADDTSAADAPPDAACPGTRERCDGRCVDTQADPDHCGACGRACAPRPNQLRACRQGTCVYECLAGCPGSPETGCGGPVGSHEACGSCATGARRCDEGAGYACFADPRSGGAGSRCCHAMVACGGMCGAGEVCLTGGDSEMCCPQ